MCFPECRTSKPAIKTIKRHVFLYFTTQEILILPIKGVLREKSSEENFEWAASTFAKSNFKLNIYTATAG